MDFCKITIVGRITRDPELRHLPNGTAVCDLNMAYNRRYTGSDGNKVEETAWFHVSVFGKMAETCVKYLSKGREVLVEGIPMPDRATGNPRIWVDNDGNPRSTFDVKALNVQFGSGGKNSNTGSQDSDDSEYGDSEPVF